MTRDPLNLLSNLSKRPDGSKNAPKRPMVSISKEQKEKQAYAFRRSSRAADAGALRKDIDDAVARLRRHALQALPFAVAQSDVRSSLEDLLLRLATSHLLGLEVLVQQV